MMIGQEKSPLIQRKRARSRKAILDAAEAKFSLDGYQGVRVEAIAADAEVSVGAVYTHFGGKDDLFVSVATRILDRADAYFAEALQVTASPLEQVGAIGTAYMNLLFDHPFLARVLVSHASVPQAVGSQARIGDRVDQLYGLMTNRIEAAIAAGEAIAVDAGLLAQFLVASWNGVCAARFQPVGPQMTDEEVGQCLDQAAWLLYEGITAPAFRDADGHSRALRHEVPRPAFDPVV